MRSLVALALTLGLLGGLAAPALAEVGDVIVGGVLILRIRAEAGGMSIEQRVVVVHQRIVEALSRVRPFRPEAVAIRMVGGQPTLFVGDIMIITVDANHARLNGSTQQALAEIWARNLREGLPKAVPQPVVGPAGPTPAPSPSP